MKHNKVALIVSLFFFQFISKIDQHPIMGDDWTKALPFKRTLKLTDPATEGKDVVILQNLLRRYPGINLTANGEFDKSTEDALRYFQKSVDLTPVDGVLNPSSGEKIIKLLMHDQYKDDGTIPDWCKYKLHVPIHRDRNIETTATLYAGNGDVLYKFTIRTRGGTGTEGNELNQLTTNGNTPTGLSTFDLNSKEPEKLVKSFGPYPVLRVVKGIKGNSAIGKDNYTGIDGRDTFLSNYRTGILLHTGQWDGWHEGEPMPNSHGCMHVAPSDQKAIVDILISKTGAIVNENPFGKLPYPYKSQGIISIEEID